MSEGNSQEKADVERLRTNEKKWSKPLMAAGWNVIPNVIIEKQEALGLDAIDMNIVVHLSHYWWHPDNLPHPSVATIAKAIGVKPRTVQKHIKRLEAANLVKREERRHTKLGSATNLYDLSGLIEAAKPFAAEKMSEITRAKEAKKERLSRKKPRLVVDNEI
ncbi:helix-turn-helix domain-containing protein [Pararhizobium sp. YC-54]|uniref:helix-turn-helix domain-containing protein n=1 Tax=Pararhizobium sp. YC-54 TaxID=2986920 RepID=UPI0021F6ECF3|nr:helix-turn-helix domain-containing protein [Pararhizobium sp. YC-54]MCV9999239.1 helix-turn-helix domain-containing protein [Pararhizobium sp. YC-54]